MKKGLVNIAQGSPEQLSKLKIFIENMKNIYPDRKLKTLAYGVEFAIEQAQKVPELENENKELKKRIEELEEEIENLDAAIDGMSSFNRERAKEVSDGMYKE